MDPQETTTTLDALDASLQELTKAAQRVNGGQPLMKSDGVQIENSGTEGSDGHQDGGQGSVSDAGSIESLMIGKLSASGFDAGTIATMLGHMKDVDKATGGKFFHHERPSPSMTGKKGKKPPMPPFKGKAGAGFEQGGDDDEPDDDEDDAGGGGGGFPPAPPAGGPAQRTRKSFADTFAGDPDIGAGVDVSPFLESLTARTTEALDAIDARMRKSQKRLKKSVAQSDEQFVVLAKSVVALGALCKSQQHVIKALGDRLGIVEKQPAALPKGATSLEGGPRPLAKALGAGTPGGMGGPQSGSLKKSEVASVLTFMHLEKGMKEVAGMNIATQIVPLVESGGCPESVMAEVQNFLKRNPGEASLAKSYA